jgi:hypothetical protein
MHNLRARRRGTIDLHRITIGDYIVLVASLLTLVSLFMPWFVSSLGPARSQWAFTYSEVASVLVILGFLITVFLVLYPALSPDLGLPALPVSPPLPLLTIGVLLLLLFDYELGKYGCVQCDGVSRGYGTWVAIVSSAVYIVGAIIKWGSKPLRPRS